MCVCVCVLHTLYRYTGFCALGALWQSLESADHRASLGMPEGLTGIYITGVEPCYPAAKVRGCVLACVRCMHGLQGHDIRLVLLRLALRVLHRCRGPCAYAIHSMVAFGPGPGNDASMLQCLVGCVVALYV